VTDPVIEPAAGQITAGAHDDSEADEHGNSPAPQTAGLPGLANVQAGYALRPEATLLPSGRQVRFAFAIHGPDGSAVTRYTTAHDKDLHLVVVRRDLTGYQHVHPVRASDGTWSAQLDLGAAGTYRAFADFTPAALGRNITLGIDLFVAGRFAPAALPVPVRTSRVGPYDVRLDATPVARRESELTFTVTRAGSRVTSLEPYLGAFGHLVALRGGDLAYLHTHPAQEAHAGARGGPAVRFTTAFPTAGAYRLFLDFKVGATVRTAAFTVTVP